MAGSQGAAAQSAARTNARLAQQAYDIGIPAQQAQFGAIDKMLRWGGEMPYMTRAFEVQRTGLEEGMAGAGRGAYQQQQNATAGAQAGGNLTAGLDANAYGAKIANALMGSRVQQGMGAVEEFDKMLGFGLGASQNTGNAAVSAAQNQLAAISMMPKVSPYYEGALGLANAAGAIYGGINQPGGNWFGGQAGSEILGGPAQSAATNWWYGPK